MIKDALRAAVNEVMRHQWSNSSEAMHALQCLIDAADEAADEIERLRAALAESEQEPTKFTCPSCGRGYNVSHVCGKGGGVEITDCTFINTEPVLTKSEQEPVAIAKTWHKNGEQHADILEWLDALDDLPDGDHNLYARPVRAKSLTDEEIEDCMRQSGGGGYAGFARAVERKVRGA